MTSMHVNTVSEEPRHRSFLTQMKQCHAMKFSRYEVAMARSSGRP